MGLLFELVVGKCHCMTMQLCHKFCAGRTSATDKRSSHKFKLLHGIKKSVNDAKLMRMICELEHSHDSTA